MLELILGMPCNNFRRYVFGGPPR